MYANNRYIYGVKCYILSKFGRLLWEAEHLRTLIYVAICTRVYNTSLKKMVSYLHLESFLFLFSFFFIQGLTIPAVTIPAVTITKVLHFPEVKQNIVKTPTNVLATNICVSQN